MKYYLLTEISNNESALCCKEMILHGAINLSEKNEKVLTQRGAKKKSVT